MLVTVKDHVDEDVDDDDDDDVGVTSTVVRQRLTLPKAQKTAFDHSLECHPAIMMMMIMMVLMMAMIMMMMMMAAVKTSMMTMKTQHGIGDKRHKVHFVQL